MDILKEIDVLIRARYPIIYIISWEETRVTEELAKIGSSRGKKTYIWTIDRGLLPYGTPLQSEKLLDTTKDPLNAIETVTKSTESAIYIFEDFHPFLGDPVVIRKLRTLSCILTKSHKTLILLSPLLKLPPELEKNVTVLDFDLPDIADLDRLIDRIVAQVKDNPQVSLNLDTRTREQIIRAALGLTTEEAENAFAKAIVLNNRLGPEEIPLILSEKKQIIRKSGLLEYCASEESLENVGGLDILKDWLGKRNLAFSKEAQNFGLPEPKGILLLGVQGCGKSLCAKAVSSLWKMPLLRLDMGKIFSSLVGSSEENTRKAISIAESIAPDILWIDEIEKAFAGTQSSTFSDAGTTARVFGGFISWLQEKKTPVFVIATANNIEQLPPELMRKGRFDEIFFVDLPRPEERKEIFSIHLKKRKRNPEKFDLEKIARVSVGFSGAEIEQVVISALFDAFQAGKDITTDFLLNSIKQTVPLSVTMKENLDNLRNWAATRCRPASSPGEIEELPDLGRKLEL
ncbi:MAG: AAA family ATPase [Candidatus Omnitrophota bacterium]